MSDQDDPGPDTAPDDIKDGVADDVTEPLLRELERTAMANGGIRPAAEQLRRPRPGPTARGTRGVASGAVEVGLRAVERAAFIPRRMVTGLLGLAAEEPPPPAAPSDSRRRSTTAEGDAPAGTTASRGATRSVRSALMGAPGAVTGSPRPTSSTTGGRPARQVLSVHNRSAQPFYSLRFRCTDLVSRHGSGSIPASVVSFDPASLTLPARSTSELTVTVHVPFGQAPGEYVGVVQAAGAPSIQTVVEIEVG